jgi:uncharacterized protein
VSGPGKVSAKSGKSRFLAALGMTSEEHASGAKAPDFSLRHAARLKPCPDTVSSTDVPRAVRSTDGARWSGGPHFADCVRNDGTGYGSNENGAAAAAELPVSNLGDDTAEAKREQSSRTPNAKAPASEGGRYKSFVVRAALFVLDCYKAYLSVLVAGSCRFEPTCSRYMYEAIARFGLARGVWLGLKRLARCQPLSGRFGYDPVPEDFRLIGECMHGEDEKDCAHLIDAGDGRRSSSSGAKAQLLWLRDAARLKPCPDTVRSSDDGENSGRSEDRPLHVECL